MTIAFFLTFALLTAPIALVKRNEVNPAIRSTITIIEHLLYRVGFIGTAIAAVVMTGIFLAVMVTEGNPNVYIGPLLGFTFNTALAIVAGTLLPWLAISTIYAIRLRRSRAA